MTATLTTTRLRGIGPLAAALLCCGCATARSVPRPPAADAGGACASTTLGIETVDASRALRRQHGVPEDVHGAMVVEVLAGGPAARAGIATWDVIVRLDTAGVHEVGGPGEIDSAGAFDVAMAAARCGRSVQAIIQRGKARRTATVSPVDGLRLYADACRKGLALGCFRQGWLTAAGVGVPQDDERAEELYDEACRRGSGAACRELARLWTEAGRAADRHRLLERSCALHDASGCVDLSFLYATGQDGVARDDARATPLFVAACDGGEANGCYNAGLMYEDGRGVTADLAVAVAAYDDGCRGGSSLACDNLGTLYDQGRGVAASHDKAAALYRLACTGKSWSGSNADACVNLGRMYRDGSGVEQDPARAAELFAEVCERAAGEPDDRDSATVIARACSLLGAQYANGSGVAADWGRAVELSKKGCAGGDDFGCFNLGVIYLNANGVDRDEAAALDYFRRACDGGDGEGCFEAGLLYYEGRGAARSDPQAAAFYEKACHAGVGKGCANLGGLYTADAVKAVALFARGCELGEPIACFNLANHYADGTGVTADAVRAAELYRQACSGGYEGACAKLEPQKE